MTSQDYVAAGVRARKLTDQERSIVKLIATGSSTAEVAEAVNLSEEAVATAKESILKTIGYENFDDVVALYNFGPVVFSTTAETMASFEYTAADLAAAYEKADALTNQERSIAKLLGTGANTVKIIEVTGLSEKSVRTYRQRIYDKLGFENLAGVVELYRAYPRVYDTATETEGA
ncbi:LuxR C-terminal-related transcriptional regulator [Streptomyces sp. NPDC048659]|uniref:LuxR C-terminal-related transcriptional regulator n=1 Tax=Streptomyces sp. NPDC048659 TaxID=3155489 RepID=UPI0034397A22